MRRRWAAAVVAVGLAVAGCNGDDSPSPSASSTSTVGRAEDEAAVRATWESYRDALLARDGTRAAALLDKNVHPFYERVRTLALTGSVAEVRGLRLVEQLSVLVMRVKLDAQVLRTADPHAMLVAAVDLGLIGEQSVARLSIDEVRVGMESATARMVQDGRAGPASFVFQRRPEGWRLDLVPMLDVAESALQAEARRQKRTQDEFVDALLVASVGRERAAAAWTPVGTA